MTNPKILDLDAELGFEEEETPTRKIKLFGAEWTLLCDVNTYNFAAVQAGDPGAITRLMGNLIAEDERVAFADAFAKQKNMTAQRLGEVLGQIIAAAADRPTNQPSASARTASKRTSSPKSATSSPSRVVRSVR